MRRFVVFSLIFFGIGFVAWAQNPTSILSDTIQLEEVISYGYLKKYQSGAKIESIPIKQFKLSQDGNLENLLSRSTTFALKTNAGGLSTIRVRGTAPNHTSINFGGININSLTLGQSNVSSVPMYLFDDVGVQYGSSSSVNGSGNIGGAIHLGLKNYWTKGVKAEARLAHGSFGEQLYGVKLHVGNGKFESVTRTYYYYKTNDFPFTNPNYRDFENGIFEIEDVQQNANIENMGLLQELNYKFNEGEVLLFKVWLQDNWQFTQQNMQTNLTQPDLKETLEDGHVRIWADYKNRKNPFKYQVSSGYVFDNSIHNGNDGDSIQTQRIIGEAFIEHDFISNAGYKVGAKLERIYPKVHAYASDFEYEDRIDLYASYFHQFWNKLKLTANLRQGFVTDFEVPFTPSVGVNYIALSREKYILNLSGNIARSYRVPTFNDRYWVPGGNPDLNPEKGMNYELGSKLSFNIEGYTGNIKANLFYMNIEDWILWKNGGSYWYAENVQNVESKGVELLADVSYTMGKWNNIFGINYAFTSAKRVKSINNSNALNRQLEYVPKHSANYYSISTLKNLDITFEGSYTAEQFTDEEDKNILEAYFLFNISTGYRFNLGEDHGLKINALLNNVFNTEYQASWGYAMPGINYRLSLTYNFR